jgi:DNA-binding ferritin-like protein
MVRSNSKKAKITSSKTRKKKGNRSSVNQKSFDTMLKCMLETLMSIKLYHWNTYSYSTHKATDDIYGSLSDNMDKYAEIMIGKSNGKYRIKMSDFRNLKVDSIGNNKAMENKVKKLISDLNKFHSGLESVEYSDVANVRDEIVADLNKFLYLITLK